MAFVFSPGSRCAKDPQCTRAPGLDKASLAALNDTGFQKTRVVL
jgi:hypothetical protein